MATLDLSAHYSVESYPGIAFWLRGYATMEVEIEYHNGGMWDYEIETSPDYDKVIAVMVGDDREHIIDVDELTVIDDDAYCAGCGQISCGWH
jgi:hypothetical protein